MTDALAQNTASLPGGAVGGGASNQAAGVLSFVAGGWRNRAMGDVSAIGKRLQMTSRINIAAWAMGTRVVFDRSRVLLPRMSFRAETLTIFWSFCRWR